MHWTPLPKDCLEKDKEFPCQSRLVDAQGKTLATLNVYLDGIEIHLWKPPTGEVGPPERGWVFFH